MTLPIDLPLIDFFQSLPSVAVSGLSWLSLLGYGEAYVLILVLLIWRNHRQQAQPLLFLLLFSSALNHLLKLLIAAPRPYWLYPELLLNLPDTAFGMPSGHALSATVFWLGLALWVRHWFFWVLAIAIVLLTAISRITLGVHFPSQTLAGVLLGLLCLTALPRLTSLCQNASSHRFLALIGPIVLLLITAICYRLINPPSFTAGSFSLNDQTFIDIIHSPWSLKGLVRDCFLLAGLIFGYLKLMSTKPNSLFIIRFPNILLGLGIGLMYWVTSGILSKSVFLEEWLYLLAQSLRSFLLGYGISYWIPLLLVDRHHQQLSARIVDG
ncbi:phosphatase PAP2 family protein [Zooshikella marina]|uniref:phosphatase PAP2 family protein n=1 Tax=Zooshikella ganghwensis TaxID=202772 RepID=UPI001BAE56FE|nr:phosphatase PAP2 family protein [Zooshikella ganghwensis]MBU2705529.1 phosphatase PAP2 family protein [Zooshikella ganghwensis]